MGYTFHEYRDLYRLARKHGLLARGVSSDDAYAGTLEHLLQNAERDPSFVSNLLQMLAERRLTRSGRPYCKIHPGVAAMLAGTSVEIDCAYLKPTHPVLEVRLPMTNNPLRESNSTPALRAMLVAYKLDDELPALNLRRRGINISRLEGDRLSFWFDFGEEMTTPSGTPVLPMEHAHVRLRPGDTLQKRLEEMPLDVSAAGYRPSQALIRAAVAMAICCYFFIADQHELIAPDVIARHVDRYRRATTDHERQKVLADSRKVGHNGWEVGREIELPRPIVTLAGDSKTDSDPTGRTWEARHSHIRSGHLRRQPYGPRENPEYRIVFIKPAVVRPDLPVGEPTRFVIRGDVG